MQIRKKTVSFSRVCVGGIASALHHNAYSTQTETHSRIAVVSGKTKLIHTHADPCTRTFLYTYLLMPFPPVCLADSGWPRAARDTSFTHTIITQTKQMPSLHTDSHEARTKISISLYDLISFYLLLCFDTQLLWILALMLRYPHLLSSSLSGRKRKSKISVYFLVRTQLVLWNVPIFKLYISHVKGFCLAFAWLCLF